MVRAAVLQTSDNIRPYVESRPVVVEELTLAATGPRMVKVDVEMAGLCHSDLSVVNGARTRPVPMVLGHEASGTVIEVGPEVQAVQVGDRVAFTFQPHCGDCDLCTFSSGERCSKAFDANIDGTLIGGATVFSREDEPVHHHTGVSAFAEQTVVHESSVIRVDDDVPFDVAALLGCAVTTGGGAIKNAARLQPGERVAIVGAGGVGMAALLLAKALGAESVDVVDPAVVKHEMIRELGASEIYGPGDAPLDHYDVVVEAAGVGPALETSLPMLRAGGRLVSVGLPSPTTQVSLNYLDIVSKSKSVIGSYHGSGNAIEDLGYYIDLWRQGRLPLERLVTRTVGLDDLNEAMDALADATVMRQLINVKSGDPA
ncbi:alcohol dehydrogenase catalytic domain-containing protein [Nesterenkonia jeotgali]|uniref:Enoyl reductase (ER) domain-containing protein n=1 Tax=Nesterenkonia jeotgali TaxID=317018 RepID=A0A0W8IG59_9MICC|nr:alcohol dehydrogenase catalytic domain-containing protein [Nesterenkonia jeotgali]KUG58885.1 hypothetical protein AVL63_02310 [Nesterenkonia jeotgali]